MKKKLLVLFLLIFIGLSNTYAQAPDWQWAKGEGLAGWNDAGTCIVTDADGNVFVSGEINGKYLIKYDSLGNVLWSKNYGAGVSELTLDSLGNIFLIGMFSQSSISFGSFTLTNSGPPQNDMFIVKLDPLGNELWAKSSVAGLGTETATSVVTDRSNNVYVTGYFSTSTATFGGITLTKVGPWSSYSSAYCVKYDPSGNVLWARSGGRGNHAGEALAVDKDDNILMAGMMQSPMNVFGSDTLIFPDTLYTNIFVVKFDAAGNELWAKGYGGRRNDRVSDAAIDKNDNLFLSGQFTSDTLKIGPHTLVNSGPMGSEDVLLMKLDSTGNVLFATNPIGTTLSGTNRDYSHSVATDTAGNAYVTGSFYSTSIDFGADILVNSAPPHTDVFIVKYNSVGTEVWVKGFGGNYLDYSSAIAVNKKNEVFITGNYGSASLTFGSLTLIHTSPPIGDYYVAKLSHIVDSVWPGDANRDFLVDNNDLLPVGLWYSQTGFVRPVTGNVWQADACNNWAILQTNGKDIKNADCNGDGTINQNDTLAINLNFSLTHAFAPSSSEFRLVNPDLYFTSSSGIYPPGAWIDVDIMVGTSTLPVSSLYGMAFDIQYDASLVQAGTESLIYPNSWFASPGTNAIKIGKIDALANKAYGAETRITHTNADGFGKIATFRFQTNSSISSLSTMNFSFSGYMANDSVGNTLLFNPQPYSVVVDPLATAIAESGDNEINIYPNPNNGNFNVMFTSQEKLNYKLELRNVLGQVVYQETLPDFVGTYSKPISLSNYGKGVYTITLTNDKHDVVKKIIVY